MMPAVGHPNAVGACAHREVSVCDIQYLGARTGRGFLAMHGTSRGRYAMPCGQSGSGLRVKVCNKYHKSHANSGGVMDKEYCARTGVRRTAVNAASRRVATRCKTSSSMRRAAVRVSNVVRFIARSFAAPPLLTALVVAVPANGQTVNLACRLQQGGQAECVEPDTGPWYAYAAVATFVGSDPPCWVNAQAQVGGCSDDAESLYDGVRPNWQAKQSGTLCSGPDFVGPLSERISWKLGTVQSYGHDYESWTGYWSGSTCAPQWMTPGPTAWRQRWVRCPPDFTEYNPSDPKDGYCFRLKREGCPAGNPIQCAGGQNAQAETDISRQGASPLEFVRYYSSTGFCTSVHTEKARSELGPKWRHSWQSAVVVEPGLIGQDTYAYVTRPDGDYRHFRLSGGAWLGRPDKPETLVEVISGGVRTGWTYTAADNSIYRYDAAGRWLSLEQHGLVSTLTYSDATTPPSIAPVSGLLILVTDARGRSLQFRYDADGYLIEVTAADGQHLGIRYKTLDTSVSGAPSRPVNLGLVAFVDRPDGSTREYKYDEPVNVAAYTSYKEQLTGIVDEKGDRYATYQYDSAGRAYKEWHGSANADLLSFTFHSYNSATSTTELLTSLGQKLRRKFVAVNGVVRDAGTDRCATANCSSVVATSSTTYDGNGNVDLATDFNGVVTDHDYNSRGLETKRVDASNASGANAATKRTTETIWNASFNVPDQRAVKNSTGIAETQTKWAYNTRGQAIAYCQVDPAVSGASSYYCGSSTDTPAGVRQTLTSYCESADVTAGACPLVGLVTAVNGARQTTDAGMASGDDIATYTYRMADDSTCASGGACTYRKGDLWKANNALGQVTEYVSYDKNGRVTRVKDANGTYTDFVYHARGWLTDRSVRESAVGTPGAGDATLHIDYDAVGNVTKVTQPDGAYLQYTYDDAHRLIKITDNLSNSIDYCPGGVGTADCLDAAGNRKVEQVKDASLVVKRQLRRVYNQLGQLTQVLNAANVAVETSAGIAGTNIVDGYDRNGNRVLKDDGLAVRTQQDYDPLNRLKKTIQNLAGADTATQNTSTSYTYDARDNLRQVTDPDSLNTVYTPTTD
ncbi:MAG: RHS repeat domain-containing protein [Dokdonella sp.]|uniref:RHS repeat domain-containing protein n=1 Tax=Dokdonella sp. TaxID=2291710 RepID=UPI003F7F92D7